MLIMYPGILDVCPWNSILLYLKLIEELHGHGKLYTVCWVRPARNLIFYGGVKDGKLN